MSHEAITYSVLLVAVLAGVAALLAGEFFHGVKYLIPVGGGVALLAVGGITLAISRAGPAEH